MSRFFIILLSLLFSQVVWAKENQSLYFLAMADIHFDPFFSGYKSKARPCKVISRLRTAPVSRWKAILAEADKTESAYQMDTNYPLLQINLNAAKKAVAKHPVNFVLVLGDSLSHKFRYHYRKYTFDKSQDGFQNFVRKTLRFVNSELENTFPDTSVFMVVGNNDTYSRNYQSISGGAFFHDAASIWSTLIKNPTARATMRREFANTGYYAVDLPGSSKLRLIALNSVLFSKKSVWRNAKAAAKRQLDWLGRQLKDAKAHNQKVIIALHIPTVVDVYATRYWRLFTLMEFWRPEFIKRFKSELSEYYPQVASIFSGHLHYDWTQTLVVGDHKDIPVIGVPAISPIFGSDPGFKIYHYSIANSHIDDYYTYVYPVSGTGTWSIEHVYDLFSRQKK